MYTRTIRRCSNCAQDVPTTNHAAEFICDDCRRIADERRAREIQWRRDRTWVEQYIHQNWREMKQLANETWEAA
jgi:predicted RNA-binding Zn-ribbon protein involved in translation (DUF1610 family)